MRIGTILKHIFATTLLAAISSASWALDASHYAQRSVLSEGKWATVEVSETGMTLITDAMLRNLGFSNASKVRVYGTGGSMVAEALDISMPDDLPMVPTTIHGRPATARVHTLIPSIRTPRNRYTLSATRRQAGLWAN